MRIAHGAVPLELLRLCLELTWDGGEWGKYDSIPAAKHLAVLWAAQLVDRRFNAASEPMFGSLIPSSGHAARWLSAMSGHDDAERRVGRVRIVVALHTNATTELVRRCAESIEVLSVADGDDLGVDDTAWSRLADTLVFPSLRWLEVDSRCVKDVARLVARVTTMSTLCVIGIDSEGLGNAGAPQWPKSVAASLLTLRLGFAGENPVSDLINLHLLRQLRSLQLTGLFAREIGPLFAAMSQPAPSPTHLSVAILELSIEDEEADGIDLQASVPRHGAAISLDLAIDLALSSRTR